MGRNERISWVGKGIWLLPLVCLLAAHSQRALGQLGQGACCQADGTCEIVSSQLLCPPPGVFFAGGSCLSGRCVGACCASGGGCREMEAQDCPRNGFAGAGRLCVEVECMGACCRPDGSCVETGEGGCSDLGGSFTLGAACQETVCAGACCLADGACVETGQGGCASSGGSFTLGAACQDTDCLGACCLNDGSCVETGQVNCAGMGGGFVAGAACQETGCIVRLGTVFTYQGRLKFGEVPLDDTADFEFTLWNSQVAGSVVGGPVAVHGVQVVDGQFSVQIDFAAAALNGDAGWLEIQVRSPHDPSDTQPFTTLSPRQRLTGTPYALQTRGLFVDDAGKVGIGTESPVAMLDVAGAVNAAGGFVGDGSGLTNLPIPWQQSGANIYNTNAGNVGIGTSNPAARLDVRAVGDGATVLRLSTERPWEFRQEGTGADAALKLVSTVAGSGKHFIVETDGRVVVPVLEITAGGDLAEPFDVRGKDIRPGMVVAIDPAHPGELRLADQAYDRTVAGVISGANGIKAGLVLRQADTIADGAHPVALSGRTWCWCDADVAGTIAPGDLLTSSDTAGHAMKVVDHDRARGAIIGKAMTALESGRGLVLVLVSLQ